MSEWGYVILEYRLVQLGADWCYLVQIRATWCNLVQFEATWCSLIRLGADWCNLMQNGAVWCNLVQIATTWCNLVQFEVTWRSLVQLGADWCNLVQISATWCRLVQLGSVWGNLVQFGVIWCNLVQLGADYKSLIVWVNVDLDRTVVVDSDCFDNLCGSHLQSQSELYHVSWWYYTLVIDLIGQLKHWGTSPSYLHVNCTSLVTLRWRRIHCCTQRRNRRFSRKP